MALFRVYFFLSCSVSGEKTKGEYSQLNAVNVRHFAYFTIQRMKMKRRIHLLIQSDKDHFYWVLLFDTCFLSIYSSKQTCERVGRRRKKERKKLVH